jgi:hypothetical protein
VACALAACGSSDREPAPALGRELAGGIAYAVTAAAALAEPFRCAELAAVAPGAPPATRPLGEVGGRRLELDGDTVRVAARRRDRAVVVGAVADARGARPETLAQIRRAATSFKRDKVELVIALGGMGATQQEIAAGLGALADGPWLVWALPGDRESIPAHRAALAELGGGAILDGTAVRMVEMDGVLFAGFPGVEAADQLLAGADGCVHRTADAEGLAARLAVHKGPRVWVGHAPPRQRGPGASDVALGGVHIGERALAQALPAARAHLLVHGLVDQAALGAARGNRRLSAAAGPLILGTGPIEAAPVAGQRGPVLGGAALVARVGPKSIRWQRLLLPLAGE